jgi:hypothetical protein
MNGKEQVFHFIRLMRFCRERRSFLPFTSFVGSYFEWKRSLEADAGDPFDGPPWLSLPAVDFLKKHLRPTFKILEYGSGVSTVYFARRAQEVISIEHDENWFRAVEKAIRDRGISNWKGLLIPPEKKASSDPRDPSDWDQYASGSPPHAEFRFASYARACDRFPDEYFDVAVVDGRARPSCLKHARFKVKKGGYLILDNTERDYYLPSVEKLKGEYTAQNFPGAVPRGPELIVTTLMRRRG